MLSSHRFLQLRYRSEAIIGIALILLGGMTVSGWLFQVTSMVEIARGLVPMVFNTGLCFLLSGFVLFSSQADAPHFRSTRAKIGAFLVVLGSLTLIEHIFDYSLSVDMAFLHTWHDYGNSRPGRMAPNTAVGFVLIGLISLLSRNVNSKKVAVAVVSLTFCVLAIGLTGLVGYLLAPDLLFGWARSARMALHTATGMILGAIGLWLWWSKSQWYVDERFFREVGKIRFLSTGILIIVAMTAGLSGFALLQGSLEIALENRLEAVIQSRSPWLKATTTDTSRHALAAMRLVGISAPATIFLTDPGNTSAAAAFDVIAQRLRDEGYRRLIIENANGTPVRVSGQSANTPAFKAPLANNGALDLVWEGETLLHIRQPLVKDGKQIGSLRIDKAMPSLQRPLFNMASLGSTAELAACTRERDQLVCLPNGRNEDVSRIPLSTLKNRPLPMELALSGKTGIIHTLDYRNQNVIAAYGQLVPGLGFVAKQDTKETYGIIRNALGIGAPIILVVSILGAMFLHSQLNPLVLRMRRSESNADDAARETRSIMEAAGDGIITINNEGIIQSLNNAACVIFGYTKDELVRKNVTMLMPAHLAGAHGFALARAAEGDSQELIGKPNVQVDGLKKDGRQFPLELTINIVPLSDRKLFVGVMRDITQRKETEEKLVRLAQYDVLTSLPNRALFMDRLNTAVLRANRSGTAMVLMFVDLDGFKGINDKFGHQCGDELLKQVALRLTYAVRKSDTVARLGGDEFTIILENLNAPSEDAKAVAEKIVKVFRAPFHLANQEARVTASVGMVVHQGSANGVEAAGLLRRADAQMYTAKHAGKNMFSVECA